MFTVNFSTSLCQLFQYCTEMYIGSSEPMKEVCVYTVKMNMLYLINKIVATDYKQYYLLN